MAADEAICSIDRESEIDACSALGLKFCHMSLMAWDRELNNSRVSCDVLPLFLCNSSALTDLFTKIFAQESLRPRKRAGITV